MDSNAQHIDIPTDKAIDWLVSRGQLPADWLLQLKSVQAKLKGALAKPAFAIPPDTARQIEADGSSYLALVTAFDALALSLLQSRGLTADHSQLKTFFGSYSDPPLKAIHALLSLYRKKNLFLAEDVRFLAQAANFDLPQLKKSVVAGVKQNADLLRKVTDTQKSARELQVKSAQQLRENWHLSFISNNLAQQLRRKAEEDVPALINDVISKTKDSKFGEAVEYYREFTAHCLSAPVDPSPAAPLPVPFPTILAVRSSELLAVPESSKAGEGDEKKTDPASEAIDWGIEVEGSGDGTAAAPAAINWDADEDSSAAAVPPAEGGGIDWGEDGSVSSAPVIIDWGIETTESGSDRAAAAAPASLASPGASSVVSLEVDSTRHAFFAELQELESFLSERVLDLSASDDLAQAAFQGAGVPHILTLQSQQTAQAYLSAVRTCLAAFRAPRLTQLLLIRTSQRSVDRVVSVLHQQASGVTRLERAAVEHEARRLELQRATSRSQLELTDLISRTRRVKTHAETEISALFQSRPVHIVGEISNLIS